MDAKKLKTIDAYIQPFPSEVQKNLKKMREIIHTVCPDAVEAISYGMPTFKLNGKNLVHFAGWKKHIGFYPTPSGIEKFKKELSQYEGAKGSIQFPLDKHLPEQLIADMVKYRVEESKVKNK